MDLFAPDDVQLALRQKIRDFAVETFVDDRGNVSEQDLRKLWKSCGDAGLLGLLAPKSLGGSARTIHTCIHALEALGEDCPENGLTLAVNGFLWAVCTPLLTFASEDQKTRYLPELISGEKIGCFALSEMDSGSDALALQATAQTTEAGYVLNGEKAWVGMAPLADMAIVLAKTDPSKGPWGLSAFIVERTDAGVTFGRPMEKTGLETSFFGEIHLKDCHISPDRRLGPEGAGQSLFSSTMEWERAFIFASHVGTMARQLTECTNHARSRETYGKPIIGYQSVSNRLADMRVRLETSRLLLHRAAILKDQGQTIPQESAMNKLHISEAFAASSLDALRIFGARGYLAGTNQDQDFRDSAGGVIYSGTSDIQRQIISRLL
ncbi:MAG: acyl-CoA dehydrogenase family protein [Paracoccaceae bacterium]